MSEPTEGPWIAAPTIHPGEVRGPHGPVAYVSLAVPIEQRHATVSLLAAAPDLLAALEKMRSPSRAAWMTMGSALRSQCEAAIAKAKGEADA